ncbi:hypothetical protein NK553_15690 [Pseudomonas sp. ZM23]|uniref:Lipoprotein n=1 Tax=Pseudomonas triclosanedens TaxID=2961893 RepID=A0ABY6ZVQ2_9PSED|nr:hypothetical protein [Pseudomonas triclosanedens]MCP8465392.1 hypothetical protein [Pseudomonas triclosanedens]MCP8470668.1 hypothetical protein [Pseudomonas triclosanedens]MCP8476691.1 hypothetical protein [Pseudomonas triclosanedens]WAI48856.1 hypothetical protein OU419_24405 [Pseudomonas triclosanedens]
MHKKYVLAGMITAALLSGCNGEDKPAAAQPAQSSASQAPSKPMTEAEIAAEKRRRVFNPTPEERAQDAAEEAARHADDSVTVTLADAGKNEDFGSYLEIDNGLDMALLYNSLTESPASPSAILETNSGWTLFSYDDKKLTDLLHKYGNARDSFDKRDIAAKIEPLIIAREDSLKKNRFVKIDLGSRTDLSKYDFDRKGFANNHSLFQVPDKSQMTERQKYLYGDIPLLRPTISFSDVSNYNMGVTNGKEFQFLPIEDEQVARKLEKYVAERKQYSITIYGVVNELRQGKLKKTEPQRTMYMTVQKMVIWDTNDPKVVLATIGG